MLTQTSETAIRALIYLALQRSGDPVQPRFIAQQLGASPTYMAKITQLLTKAALLRAHRGALGGVKLMREPREITLLQIVEACQGVVIGDFCQSTNHDHLTCAYHQAVKELYEATIGILSRWTLADLAKKTCPSKSLAGKVSCRMGALTLIQKAAR